AGAAPPPGRPHPPGGAPPPRLGVGEAVGGSLVDSSLPAVYPPRPSPPVHEGRPALLRSYDPGRAERWLAFLARHLHRQQTWDLAWWRLDRAVPRHTSGLLMGLPPAPLFAASAGLAAGPIIGLIYGLSFALAGSVAPAT